VSIANLFFFWRLRYSYCMHTRDKNPTLAYITRTFVRPPHCVQLAVEAAQSRAPHMQLSPFEGHMLAWLVRMSGAVRILEIGTFMGYSTLWMASAMPVHGRMVALEKSAEYAALARSHFDASPYGTRMEIAVGDACEWLEKYNGAPFDFVFIDGEKKSYLRYLELALPHLSPQAWIVADNSLLFGNLAGLPDAERVSTEAMHAMQALNMRLANAAEFDTVLLPTPEGMTVARRKH
jgi:predicted O-methyltransferase YrrM